MAQIIGFMPMICSGISMMALGMDLMGGVMYPRNAGTCLMMISMPIAINMPSTTEMGKNSANLPALKMLKITWTIPTIANGHQQERIAYRQISIPQRRSCRPRAPAPGRRPAR